MKRILSAFLPVCLIFLGCIDYDEAIILNPDGSGTVSVQYKIASSYFSQVSMMAQQFSGQTSEENDPTEGMLERDDIETVLAKSNSGIKMLAYDKQKTDDAWTWDMEFSFEDVNKLHLLGVATSIDHEDDLDQNFSELEMEPIFTQQDDGTWLFLRDIESDEDQATGENYDGDSETDEFDSDHDYDTEEGYQGTNEAELSEDDQDAGEMFEGMAEQMQGLDKEMAKHKIRFSIKFPGQIVESNATATEGNIAIWEYKLNEMSDVNMMRAVIRM